MRSWLLTHHATSPGLWVRIFKKASGVPSVTFEEVLDEGLCFGWSESLRRAGDADSYLQRFTPRHPKSAWASKRNREHVARLTRDKRMMPSGLAAVAAAKRDGRWNA